ncbi:MAG: nuclear transport factor 2 family protein [Gemmobacter sp.]|nr:nuclear transport factor 2 family protein [Gemmobacter sp.]
MTAALALVRRWVNDYFNRHDAAAARGFCAPGYTLRIGDVVFSGRDEAWLPAVDTQFRAWPGLGMTVHRTACGSGWAAVWFSEHGASKGQAAVWSGVAIYDERDGQLQGCVAQEDYFTRRRQVKAGVCDPADPPCPAPWDVQAEPPAPGAADAVLRWLDGGWPKDAAIRCDDDHITGTPLQFDVTGDDGAVFHVSGDWVAFNIRQHGTYRAGLPGANGPVASTLDVNGLVRVQAGRVVEGRVIRDRMGLWARVRGAT